jgi:transcriptional regulator with XRE-family HTH domain
MSVVTLRERVRSLQELPDPAERRRLRLAAGVSTIDVGKAIGVAPQTVGMWERGVRTPNHKSLPAYLEVIRLFREAVKEE